MFLVSKIRAYFCFDFNFMDRMIWVLAFFQMKILKDKRTIRLGKNLFETGVTTKKLIIIQKKTNKKKKQSQS